MKMGVFYITGGFQMDLLFLPVFIIAVGCVLDLLFGDPETPWYPVSLCGRFASVMELLFRFQFGNGVICGAAAWFVSTSLAVWLCWFLTWLAASAHPIAGMIAAGIFFYFSISLRSMIEIPLKIKKTLLKRDLYGARFILSRFVCCDSDLLDESGIGNASLKGIAEHLLKNWNSICFWGFAGYWIGGIPGFAAGAVFSRFTAILDLCWGSLSEHYRKFGKTAARADDLIQWIPARLTVLMIVIASLPAACSPVGAIKTLIRERKSHASPNVGPVFAALSGAAPDLMKCARLALISGLLFTLLLYGVFICL